MKDILSVGLFVVVVVALFVGLIGGFNTLQVRSCQQFSVKFSVKTVYDGGTCYVKADRLTPVDIYLWQIGVPK